MLRCLADHNFNDTLLRAVIDQAESFDVIRALDAGIHEYDDPALLAWASEHSRVILSHDVNTLVGFAAERINIGLAMAGLLEVDIHNPTSILIQDLLIVINCEFSLEGQVIFIPLR